MIHFRDVTAVASSFDSRLLATGGDDQTARIWDASDGHLLASIRHEAAVRGVAFSPQDRTLAICGDDGKLQLCKLTKSEGDG
jgi:WD40 repeat protein